MWQQYTAFKSTHMEMTSWRDKPSYSTVYETRRQPFTEVIIILLSKLLDVRQDFSVLINFFRSFQLTSAVIQYGTVTVTVTVVFILCPSTSRLGKYHKTSRPVSWFPNAESNENVFSFLRFSLIHCSPNIFCIVFLFHILFFILFFFLTGCFIFFGSE